MKSISLDFKNHTICIMKEGQKGTERNHTIKKVAFHSFIPEKYRENSSFTWDFENEKFSVNKDFTLEKGCIMTADCFIPQLIISMPGLKERYDEFVAIMGYEEVDLKEEMPIELRKLLGL